MDMRQTVCAYCEQKFRPSPRHPHQRACSSTECQQRRRADYHRKKLATDFEYREQCRDSQKKWRERNTSHIKQYDEHYRAGQRVLRSRDASRAHLIYEVRHLEVFLKRGVALHLRHFGENIVLVFPPNLPGKLLRRYSHWQPEMIWWRARAPCQRIKKGRKYSAHDWPEFLDRIILNLAGYKNLEAIAKFVHRSERLVWNWFVTFEKIIRIQR
jgi:hypothetical protein